MRALVLDGTLRFVSDYPDPKPGTGECLVGVRKAGICRTDIELTRGYMDFRGIPGHEFVGEVLAGPPNLQRRRVVGEINCPCGRCRMCRRGLGRHCPNRTVLGIQGRDGAFAEFLVLPEDNLHPVPDSIPDAVAVFTEPLAAALEIPEQVRIEPDSGIAVLGDGKLGILVAQVLNRTGARVTIWGHHREKMAPLEPLGVETRVAGEEPVVPSGEYDLAVEATGSWDGFALARDLVRPRGTIVLKSTLAAGSEINLSTVVVNELTVVGSRCGPFAPALRLLERGEVRTDFLVDAEFPFSQWERAFERANAPGAGKILIDMQGAG